MTSIHDLEAMDAWRQRRHLDPHHLRQLRLAFYKKHQGSAGARAALPKEVVAEFDEQFVCHALTLHSRHDSSLDGATKLIFRTQQDLLLETVILRAASGRTTLCVSTQVGCAARCDFCATGRMGIARNLTAAEILDQLIQANLLLVAEKRSVRNVVFMGMGEPFHNEENLYATLETLIAPEFFHHPPSRILVSTVGLPDAMIRCVRRFPAIHVALSLHSANQTARERIIPLARRYPLDELRRALLELNRIQPVNTPVMIEYLMLAGANDALDDARELVAWLDSLRVHVNLIPFNPIDDAPHLQGSDRATREAFGAHLKAAGLKTTIRYSLGADVAAACGQLVRKENRRITLIQATP